MLEEAGRWTYYTFELVGGCTVYGAFEVVDAEVVILETFLNVVAGQKEYRELNLFQSCPVKESSLFSYIDQE